MAENVQIFFKNIGFLINYYHGKIYNVQQSQVDINIIFFQSKMIKV